jgi:Protein of unknown function (DUF1552)
MTTKQLNRRLFLQGFGGVAVAAPFLGSLFERSAVGQTVGDPKRLIVFFTHYGCITNRWFPAKSQGELTETDFMGTTLESLAKYHKKLLMPRGIRAMNEWSFQQELGQETDPHTQVMNAYFTGCPTDGWSGLGANPPSGVNTATPKRKSNGRPVGGRSLDHICAEQINRADNPTPLYIGLGIAQNNAGNTMTCLSYSSGSVYDHAAHKITTEGEIYPSIANATTIYNNIVKLFDMDSGAPVPTEGSYAMARGKHVLDLCRDDLQRIKAKALSSTDKVKLEAWEALLGDVSGMVGVGPRVGCSEDAANDLMLTAAAMQAGMGMDLTKSIPVMSALATLSVLCDDNRVIFMKTPGNHTYTNVEGAGVKDHHSLSHRQGDANQGGGTCVNGVNDLIAGIDKYHADSFAALVGMLDGIPEGAGTLLDNTATVWFQELSDGNSHNLNNMPILQAGGCGGYFKTGMAINVDDGAADMSAGTSEALCNGGSTAVPSNALDSTGTPKEIANAPINKYFCNLMNAIGVKAGADGFAVKGGTEKVTHFGYYDNTKDFIGFLKDTPPPAKINDPGEFADLNA